MGDELAYPSGCQFAQEKEQNTNLQPNRFLGFNEKSSKRQTPNSNTFTSNTSHEQAFFKGMQ